MKQLLIALLLVSVPLAAAGQRSYGSTQIKAACEKTNLHKALPDSIQQADTIVAMKGREIAVRIDNGKVEHIGCHIFSAEQRSLNPSPVYDYLEFACLDQILGVSENPFVYKNLTMEGGTWKDLLATAGQSACTVTRTDNVAYKVVWTQPNGKAITATFPIGYERLYRMSRSEIEGRFISELRSMKATRQADLPDPDSLSLKPMGNGILVLEGEHYVITDVNQNLYYQKYDKGGYVLVWDKQHPAESIANMLISHDKWLTGYSITLRVPTHDRTTEEVQVTVRQLLAYAHQTGCKAYWGLESLTETELRGTLFLYNPAYGFDHVFNISCDPRLIASNDLCFTALAALFSPTTNVHNLFAKSRGKSNNKKIE